MISRPTYLQTGHDTGILNAFDGLACHNTSEIRIVACALPISTTRGQAPEGTHDRTEGDIDALSPEFMTHSVGTIIGQSLIPTGAHVNTTGKTGDEVCVADTISSILETHTREPKTLYRGDNPRAAITRRNTISEVILPAKVRTFVRIIMSCTYLLLQSQLTHEYRGFGIGMRPVPSAS